MGFSRQECWSGLPFPSPGDLPNSGIKPGSPALQADALPSEPPGKLTLGRECLKQRDQVLIHTMKGKNTILKNDTGGKYRGI